MLSDSTFGNLPRDWSIRPLGELLAFTQYGLSVRGNSHGSYPILRMTNQVGGRIVPRALQFVAIGPAELAKYRLESCDLLFNRTNSLELVGRTAIFELDGDFVFASYLIRLRTVSDRLSPHFLNFYLNGDEAQRRLKSIATRAVSQSNISASRLKGFEIPVPPLSEQRRIAAVLSAVQRATERQKRLIALIAEVKKTLMLDLFTKGTRSEPLKQQTRFGPVPASWSVVPLGECCQVQTGIAKGRKVSDADAITVPYLRVANVQAGHLDLREVKAITIRKGELSRYLLQPGDIALTEGGDLDKLGRGFIWNGQIADCVHQNHIFAVRPNRSLLSSEFLAYQTQSPYGKQYFLSVAHKTTNLACINTSKLKAFPVLIPTKEEQAEISSILQAVDQRRSVAVNTLTSLESLFRTLLHQLMTAQIRVNDLDLSTLEEAEREQVEEPAPTETRVPCREVIFAEMHPYMVDVEDLNDTRDAVYTRGEGVDS